MVFKDSMLASTLKRTAGAGVTPSPGLGRQGIPGHPQERRARRRPQERAGWEAGPGPGWGNPAKCLDSPRRRGSGRARHSFVEAGRAPKSGKQRPARAVPSQGQPCQVKASRAQRLRDPGILCLLPVPTGIALLAPAKAVLAGTLGCCRRGAPAVEPTCLSLGCA